MTSFFGPEVPEPFCVTSERHISSSLDQIMARGEYKALRKKYEKRYNEIEHHSAVKYEKDLCSIINKYLEIDCDHDVLFMRCEGDETAKEDGQEDLNDPYTFDWPAIIARKFCLTKSVDQCVISVPRRRSESKSLLNPNLSLTSSEILAQDSPFECKYLVQGKASELSTSTPPKKYDKIIIKNCLKFFEENSKYFCEYIMTLFKEVIQYKTSMLFIQRVHDLNTLPFYHQIQQDWSRNDTKYSKFMQEMQNEYFSLKFDIEVLKCIIDCKSTWYRLLKEKHPYPLKQNPLIIDENTVNKRSELVHGIRELDEGLFKYQKFDNMLEFNDRLLFIGAFHERSRTATLAERIRESKTKKQHSISTDLAINTEINKLSMEITPEIQDILRLPIDRPSPSKAFGRKSYFSNKI